MCGYVFVCFGFNISVYIEPSSGEKQKKYDGREKNIQTDPTTPSFMCSFLLASVLPIPSSFDFVLLIWTIVGQGPIALAVCVGGGCLNIFSLVYFSLFFLPLWEATRY